MEQAQDTALLIKAADPTERTLTWSKFYALHHGVEESTERKSPGAFAEIGDVTDLTERLFETASAYGEDEELRLVRDMQAVGLMKQKVAPVPEAVPKGGGGSYHEESNSFDAMDLDEL